MSAQPAVIQRRKRVPGDRPFDLLRDEGLRWLQTLCGERWTDHNLHDPGITLLEQLCYALTELAYRADFPVADHLTGPAGRIDHEGLSLHPPAEVFPCRATTAEDLRRVLLDAVPSLDDAALQTGADGPADVSASPRPPGLDGLPGLYRLTLKLSPGDHDATRRGLAQARATYRRERNLCEDLHDALIRVRDVPVDMLGEIELGGARDAVDVLAEVYHRCARLVARLPRTIGLDEARRAGQTLEAIYTGPRVRRGFLVSDDAHAPAADTLFLDDLSLLIGAIEGVAEVRLEALRSPTAAGGQARALPWCGPGWALRLRTPGMAAEVNDNASAGPTLVVRRRGHAVVIDPHALQQRFADLQAGDSVPHPAEDAAETETVQRMRSALPQGLYRPATTYRSVQHDFPAAYGLGRHGFSSSAPASEHARVRQFKAYLRLFDQVIANGRAQVDHLAELFSLNGGLAQTYWQQAVDADEAGGGVDGVLLGPVDVVLRTAHAAFDPLAERKSRAFDHVLALHGVTYRQDSLRQFGAHLDADEVDTWLLHNKAAYLRDIVVLGRDRAGAFDYSHSSWDEPSNCAGLQRRANLLLGFRLWHDRPLARVFLRQKITLDSLGAEAAATSTNSTTSTTSTGTANAEPEAQPVERVAVAADAAQLQDDLRRIAPLRSGRISPAFLRAGLRRELYRLSPSPPSRSGSTPQRLMLGPDENGRWWTLGDFADTAQAARAVDSLRRFLRHLNDDSEGLHVVEHLLLRPAATEGRSDAACWPPDDFFALRMTVVLPAWTVRTHDPAFRRFAEDTLRINCPAHLSLRCCWLEFDALQRFEDDFSAWMQAKAAHCRAVDQVDLALPTLATALDESARRVIAHVLPPATRAARNDPAEQEGPHHG